MAISRQLAERLGEQVMPLNLAVKRDLSQERRIGLVFPCYWFNAQDAGRQEWAGEGRDAAELGSDGV